MKMAKSSDGDERERIDELVGIGRSIADQAMHQIASDKGISSEIHERAFVIRVLAARLVATILYNQRLMNKKTFNQITDEFWESVHMEFHVVEADMKTSGRIVTDEGEHGVC